jgi:hypothetical protein
LWPRLNMMHTTVLKKVVIVFVPRLRAPLHVRGMRLEGAFFGVTSKLATINTSFSSVDANALLVILMFRFELLY